MPQVLYDTVNGTAALPTPPALAPASALGANVTAAECAADPRCYYAVSWDRTLQYMFIYHFFGLLWGHQFIAGFGCARRPRPGPPPAGRQWHKRPDAGKPACTCRQALLQQMNAWLLSPPCACCTTCADRLLLSCMTASAPKCPVHRAP